MRVSLLVVRCREGGYITDGLRMCKNVVGKSGLIKATDCMLSLSRSRWCTRCQCSCSIAIAGGMMTYTFVRTSVV